MPSAIDNSDSNERLLWEVCARQAINDVLLTYVRALDRMDETLLRSVFHPGSEHNHFFQGPSSDPAASSGSEPGDFVSFALQRLSTYSRTHHQLGPALIDLVSDSTAHVETYFTAFHRMRPAGDPLADDSALANETDFFVGGRYLDTFEHRNGHWRIVKRVGMTDWTRLDPVNTPGFAGIDPTTVGHRAPDDLICHWT